MCAFNEIYFLAEIQINITITMPERKRGFHVTAYRTQNIEGKMTFITFKICKSNTTREEASENA